MDASQGRASDANVAVESKLRDDLLFRWAIFARTAGERMKDVVVIGAGKIGAAVARLLASTGDYQVTLADRSPDVLGRLEKNERIRIAVTDQDSSKQVDLLNGQFAVLNAGPFYLLTGIAEAARAARASRSGRW